MREDASREALRAIPAQNQAPAKEPPPSTGLKRVKEQNCVSRLFFARWEPCLPAADRPKQQAGSFITDFTPAGDDRQGYCRAL